MAYDSAVISFTTKTDKVDLVQAAHMNSMQSEIVTTQTILGTNVKGDRADLKTRLNNALDADGSLLSGTAYPSPALPSQGFYKTDVDTYYIRNAANTGWLPQGGNLSNVVFCWMGSDLAATNSYGKVEGTSLTPDMSSYTVSYQFLGVYADTLRTVLVGRFKKISGISTITIHAKLWGNDSNANRYANLKVDIGGANATVHSASTSVTPTWVTTGDIDVSGLTNGTVYDITIQLSCQYSAASGYCSGIILTGS